MAYDLNELAGVYFINVVETPKHGYLTLKKQIVQVGTKISMADIQANNLQYHHTDEVIADSQNDQFKFNVWNITTSSLVKSNYASCYGTDILDSIPEDGIYTYAISINKRNIEFILAFNQSDINVLKDIPFKLFPDNLAVVFAPGNEREIFYTIRDNTGVNFFVRNQRNNNFTYTDLNQLNVQLVKTTDETKRVSVRACDINNICEDGFLSFKNTNKIKQIGDNVLYTLVGQPFVFEFHTNKPNALWSISNGIEQTYIELSQRDILQWSTYSVNSDLSPTDPDRGPGYNKLATFRNVREQFFQSVDLPVGVVFSNTGQLNTLTRIPHSIAGSQPWVLGNNPSSFEFTLTAIDPETGFSDTRKYKVISNYAGTNIDGLASETIEL